MATIVTQSINVDLTPGGVYPFLHVSQGDSGTRALRFYLFNDSQPYSIPSSVTSIVLEGSTPSGVEFSAGCAFTAEGTNCTANLTADMTAEAGLDMCEVVLYQNRNRLGSANFFIDVERDPIAASVDYRSSYWAEVAKTYANNASNYANVSKSWAVGGTGVRVDEVYNNSKYWCEQAYATTGGLGGRITLVERSVNQNTIAIAQSEQRIDELEDNFKEHEEWSHERLDNSVVLSDVTLVNRTGDYLVDNDGKYLIGGIYLPVTDTSGEKAGYPIDSSVVGKTFLMNYENIGIPILYLNHPDIETLKRKTDGALSNVQVIFPSRGIDTELKKFKVQGQSSQTYPKKNYTLTFAKNVIIKDEWGAHKKYVIKADWVDFSHMRNEVAAKLWGQVRRTRIGSNNSTLVNNNESYFIDNNGNHLVGETDPSLTIGLNLGAIDAFPILVVINGTYWGLYSFTIPKDDWMANMQGMNQNEAIVAAENSSVPTAFMRTVLPPNEDGEMVDSGDTSVVAFGIEYTNDEDNTGWISDSINTIITTVLNDYSTDEEYLNALSNYVDIDSLIDYYIFTCILNNRDGTTHNFLLDTWDGEKWYFAAYDLDLTFGNGALGHSIYDLKTGCTFRNYANVSRIMKIIYDHDRAALKERYNYLRSGVLSIENVAFMIWNYGIDIPKAAYDYEVLRWPWRPGTSVNNNEQMIQYFNLRCKVLDEEISSL